MTSPASIVDPVRYKAAVRAEWRDAAAGWRAWADVLEAPGAGLAVSRRLVELAGIGPGDSVLDLAAGYGEPGLTAARAAGPGGRVVCADISAPMLALARERAEAAGLGNLDFVEADAEDLAVPEASFDAVLSRQGLQFLPDPAGTLARARSSLSPAGGWPPLSGARRPGPVRRPGTRNAGRAGAAPTARRPAARSPWPTRPGWPPWPRRPASPRSPPARLPPPTASPPPSRPPAGCATWPRRSPPWSPATHPRIRSASSRGPPRPGPASPAPTARFASTTRPCG